MPHKPKRVYWRGFFDHSKFTLGAHIWGTNLVGLDRNHKIDHNAVNPENGAYLHAMMSLEGETGKVHTIGILIDVNKDVWGYVYEGRLVNWPPRFRITKDMRDKLYAAAKRQLQEA